jgi:glycosyltransferase involved in cell wall biosynthesis
MGKAKVLHVITHMQPGGAQDNVALTVSMLDKRRYEVWFCTGRDQDYLDRVTGPDVKVIVNADMYRPIVPLAETRAFLSVYRLIRQENFDIVHTHLSKAGFFGRLAAWLARVPVVIHSVHTFPFHDYQHPLISRAFIQLERMAAKWTDVFITMSDLNIEKALNFGIGKKSQYRTIYSGINLERFTNVSVDVLSVKSSLGIRNGEIVVGNIGRLMFQKNPTCFIQALAQVAATIPHVRGLMVGDGDMRDEVEALVKKLRLDDRVVLTGHRDDVERMMAICDVIVHTSLYEGMGRVLAEALAMGKPLVATAVDGVPEIVKDGERGLLVQPDDPGALARAIVEMLNDPSRAQTIGQAGQEWVLSRFSVETMIGRIDRLYQELLEGKVY